MKKSEIQYVHKEFKDVIKNQWKRVGLMAVSVLGTLSLYAIGARDRGNYVDEVQQVANNILFAVAIGNFVWNAWGFAKYATDHYRPNETSESDK